MLRMYLELNQEETGYALPPDLTLLVSDVKHVFFDETRRALTKKDGQFVVDALES